MSNQSRLNWKALGISLGLGIFILVGMGVLLPSVDVVSSYAQTSPPPSSGVVPAPTTTSPSPTTTSPAPTTSSAPGMSTSFALSTPGYQTITATWRPPTSGAAVSGYYVSIRPTGAILTAWTKYTITGTTTLTKAITSLLIKPYDVKVQAWGKSTTYPYPIIVGPETPALSATPVAPPLPGQPTSPAAVLGNLKFTASWKAPASQLPVVPVDGYNVCYGTIPDLVGCKEVVLGKVLSTIISGSNGTTYYWKVSARNITGKGNSINGPSVTPLPPPKPPDITVIPGNGRFTVEVRPSSPDVTISYVGYKLSTATAYVTKSIAGNQPSTVTITAANGLWDVKAASTNGTLGVYTTPRRIEDAPAGDANRDGKTDYLDGLFIADKIKASPTKSISPEANPLDFSRMNTNPQPCVGSDGKLTKQDVDGNDIVPALGVGTIGQPKAYDAATLGEYPPCGTGGK